MLKKIIKEHITAHSFTCLLFNPINLRIDFPAFHTVWTELENDESLCLCSLFSPRAGSTHRNWCPSDHLCTAQERDVPWAQWAALGCSQFSFTLLASCSGCCVGYEQLLCRGLRASAKTLFPCKLCQTLFFYKRCSYFCSSAHWTEMHCSHLSVINLSDKILITMRL